MWEVLKLRNWSSAGGNVSLGWGGVGCEFPPLPTHSVFALLVFYVQRKCDLPALLCCSSRAVLTTPTPSLEL